MSGGSWLHIDMAGPAVCAERATGYGVALLFALYQTLSLVKNAAEVDAAGSDRDSSILDTADLPPSKKSRN